MGNKFRLLSPSISFHPSISLTPKEKFSTAAAGVSLLSIFTLKMASSFIPSWTLPFSALCTLSVINCWSQNGAETITPVTSCPLVTSLRRRDSTAPLSNAPFSPRAKEDNEPLLESLRYRAEVSRLRALRSDINNGGCTDENLVSVLLPPPVLILSGVDFERDVSGRSDKVVLFHHGGVGEHLSPAVSVSDDVLPQSQALVLERRVHRLNFGGVNLCSDAELASMPQK